MLLVTEIFFFKKWCARYFDSGIGLDLVLRKGFWKLVPYCRCIWQSVLFYILFVLVIGFVFLRKCLLRFWMFHHVIFIHLSLFVSQNLYAKWWECQTFTDQTFRYFIKFLWVFHGFNICKKWHFFICLDVKLAESHCKLKKYLVHLNKFWRP